jgi:MarR family transcriptional regulator, repressor for mepA
MGPMSSLGYLLQHTANIMYRQSDQVLQERLGIGMSQYKILMLLQEHPQTQQRALADLLGQTEASVSRQIKLLCEKNMLLVEVNPKNRREHLTRPTPKGQKLTTAAQEILQEYHGPAFDQFNDKEKQVLTEMLHKIYVVAGGPRKPITGDQPFNL